MQAKPVGPQSFLYTSQGPLQTGPLMFLHTWVSVDVAAVGWGGAGVHLWGVLLTGLMLSVTCSVRCQGTALLSADLAALPCETTLCKDHPGPFQIFQ